MRDARLWSRRLLTGQQTTSKTPPIAEVQRLFVSPPADARPTMALVVVRSAVAKPELEREILAMKPVVLADSRIQPVYPLALDDKATGFRNLPYLSDEFLDAVKFAAATASKNDMRVDMTLASGWPYGGPHVPVDQAAGQLRVVTDGCCCWNRIGRYACDGQRREPDSVFAGAGTAKNYDADKLQRSWKSYLLDVLR